jgi:DNA-binding response OmpR family regulator
MNGRKNTILIVDDDEDLRAALAEQLELHEDFRAEHAATAQEGLAKALAGKPALVLLDLHLPDFDGREACRRLRAAGASTPVIMLTGADSEADTIDGFESGANDYVTKPFKFAVLLARIRAHLRNHEQNEDATFQIGAYEFRPAAKLLMDSRQKKIRLTEKETNILKYLFRSGAQPVGREELLREVWGYNSNVTTHTLETHIYRLRQKIEIDTQAPRLLLTETGGYRLAP